MLDSFCKARAIAASLRYGEETAATDSNITPSSRPAQPLPVPKDDDLQMVLELSRQEQEEEEKKRKQEEEELQKILELSLLEK
ncbi:ankyrin repeat domain-containing protein 13D [Elysia marginata]|uniref:Ankyrin repeat domain-containing protein 13D n=1 Tax=Elysia marginata TaxID=1093978 RepID=A0AAV4ESC2_9GAST|nr:ankyrin repeat domain-containing protein 13D [Elysia marginata]